MANDLRRLDLNLLVTLDALLSEQQVTRAAERLKLSQPAVSLQLAKLRELLQDPLLLPGPRGMLPTARAEHLRTPLRQALEALQQAIAPPAPFDPAQAQQTWRIAATDYTESTLLLPLLTGLRINAPGTRLAVLELKPSQLAHQAEQKAIDLAFHIRSEAPPELHQRCLFTEHYVLAGRAEHPALSKPLSIEQFCALEQAIVSPNGGGFYGITDRMLSEYGLSRRVVLSVPHFLFLTSVLASTDLVAMLPSRLVRHNPALTVIDPPIQIPGFEMLMLWHERCHQDPAHQWLRNCIASSIH